MIHSVLTEWTAANPSAATFSGTRRTLLRIGFASYLHAIQQIDFNPTATPGMSTLDCSTWRSATAAPATPTPCHRTAPCHGKLLRIDPRGTNGVNGRYGIPPSNPFVGEPGTVGEIFALGMRDPHRFSWDPVDGRMFLGHIGEHDIESVYDLRAGDNLYPLPADDARFGYDYPVAAYDHNAALLPCGSDAGHAIVGGFVYRGNALPALRGKYVFGDLVDGRVFYTNAADMVRGTGLAPLFQLRIFNSAGNQTTIENPRCRPPPGTPSDGVASTVINTTAAAHPSQPHGPPSGPDQHPRWSDPVRRADRI